MRIGQQRGSARAGRATTRWGAPRAARPSYPGVPPAILRGFNQTSKKVRERLPRLSVTLLVVSVSTMFE